MLMSLEVSSYRNPTFMYNRCIIIIVCDAVLFIYFVFTDTGFGTIYVSDDRGTVYSKSLEQHLYTTTGGETDFTNITSLRGVFITSVLAQGIY